MNSNSSDVSSSAGTDLTGFHAPVDSPAFQPTFSPTLDPTSAPASLNDISIVSETPTQNSTHIPSRLQSVLGEQVEIGLTLDSKKCCDCHRSLPLARFVKTHVSGRDYRARRCNQCRGARAKAKRPVIGKPPAIDRFAWLTEKKSAPCTDCGGRFAAVSMDFDHVKGDKRYNIAAAYRWLKWELLDVEVAKCELVCANCHRVRSSVRKQSKGRPPKSLAEVEPDPAEVDLTSNWVNRNL